MIRINELASLITASNLYSKAILAEDITLIDIGADHGLLGIKLLKEKKIKEVWNVEISTSALSSCEKRYRKECLLPFSKFIVSDGFSNLSSIPNNSIVVIAGLGNKTIIKILNKSLPQNLNTLILLSHTYPISIRSWANDHQWTIEEEQYFEDNNIIYLLIKLIKPLKKEYLSSPLSKEDIFFGKSKFFSKTPKLMYLYWEGLKKQIENIPIKYRKNWESDFLTLWNNLKDLEVFMIKNICK